jgi:hypothetical protein
VAEEPGSPKLAPVTLIGDVRPLQGRRRAPNRGARRELAREASRCCAGAPLGIRPAARSSSPAGEPPPLATAAGRRGTRAAAGAARRVDLIGGAELAVTDTRGGISEIQPLPSEPTWELRRPSHGKKPNSGISRLP